MKSMGLFVRRITVNSSSALCGNLVVHPGLSSRSCDCVLVRNFRVRNFRLHSSQNQPFTTRACNIFGGQGEGVQDLLLPRIPQWLEWAMPRSKLRITQGLLVLHSWLVRQAIVLL